MIIITDANGNLQAPTIPENIYQGSNKANSIVFLSPLAQSNTATIMFRLPSGLLTPEYLMNTYDDVPSQYNLNAWVRDIDSDITALYGTVTYQIKLTNATGTIVTSVAGTFNVLRGVAPLPSTTPSTTNWTEILSYLSQINSDIGNGWLVSKGILPYDVNFAYPLNASVWNKTNNTIYTSLVDDNLGNALTDTSKWGATSLVAMSDLNDYYTKGETENYVDNKYVGSEYISVDDGQEGTLQEGKKVVRLDTTNVETEQASENSNKLITSGAVFNSLQVINTQIGDIGTALDIINGEVI